MKRRLLLSVLAATLSFTLAIAQSCQVFGTWKKLPKDFKDYSISVLDRLGDNYVILMTYEYGGKKVAVVDENLKILRSMDFRDYFIPKSDRKRIQIKNGFLEFLYIIYQRDTRSDILMRRSYDLQSMQLVKTEELLRSVDLEPDAKDLLGGVRIYDFDTFIDVWSDNGEYVGIITNRITQFEQCVNLAVYDRHFNKIAEEKHLDRFRLPKMKHKELMLRIQDYKYDYSISNDGKLTFVRSVSKRFLESDGSDIAVYELSKEGFKRHDFGKPLSNCLFYSPDLLQVKDGKVLVLGIYAPVADKKNFRLEGCCTLELDLETNQAKQVEMKPFEKDVKGSWKYDFLSQNNITEIKGPFWKTSNGWIKLFSSSFMDRPLVAFIDGSGRVKSIYSTGKYSDKYRKFVYNNKLYFATWLKSYYENIDENGNKEQYPVTEEHPLYWDCKYYQFYDNEPNSWPFFKVYNGNFIFGKLLFQ